MVVCRSLFPELMALLLTTIARIAATQVGQTYHDITFNVASSYANNDTEMMMTSYSINSSDNSYYMNSSNKSYSVDSSNSPFRGAMLFSARLRAAMLIFYRKFCYHYIIPTSSSKTSHNRQSRVEQFRGLPLYGGNSLLTK